MRSHVEGATHSDRDVCNVTCADGAIFAVHLLACIARTWLLRELVPPVNDMIAKGSPLGAACRLGDRFT
jgi:hypothetical protein